MKHMFSKSILIALAANMAVEASAATQYTRLVWDKDGSTSAVIGFSPDGTSTSPYVSYGYSTDEGTWSTASVSNTETFNSLINHFVRLENLTPNTEVFFRVCDNAGCGDRFYFLTAPNDDSPYVMVAGGDTRTGWTTRRQGNQLLAKIRPLGVMHGGDFTNANNRSEMEQLLTDWQLMYSSDTIDGYSYKRVYPMIPTHGNHEDNNFSTLCQVWGVDYNDDNNCSTDDTYGAVQVSPLLRVYTLNSQFMNSGYSSYAVAQNNWLSGDLASAGASSAWRFAQYHKPMFPHYTGKSENQTLFNWWAQDFYDYGMNLVVESDTHLTKVTDAVEPSGSTFASTTSGGTIYVGEGSWGAPARSANDGKSWTIDMASIQQFKVIEVNTDEVVVRTAQFDSSASALTRAERAADPLALPAGVNWWNPAGVGEAMTVTQSNMRSVISTGGSGGGEESLSANADVFISETHSGTNYDGSSEGLLADGDDSTYGQLYTMIKFDLNSLSQCTSYDSVVMELNVTNVSTGTYQVYSAVYDWQEGTATWNSVGGSAQLGTNVGSFAPSATGTVQVDLTASGILEDWIANGNVGLVIAPNGATDGVDMTSKESGQAPVLKVASECVAGGGSGGSTGGSYTESNVSGSRWGWQHFTIDVESGMTELVVTTTGGSGNGQLYVNHGSQPSYWSYDCRSTNSGNEETCVVDTPDAGTWYLSIFGAQAFSGVSLSAEWQ